jgi:hypothetical protein
MSTHLHPPAPGAALPATTFQIEGMTCASCVRAGREGDFAPRRASSFGERQPRDRAGDRCVFVEASDRATA